MDVLQGSNCSSKRLGTRPAAVPQERSRTLEVPQPAFRRDLEFLRKRLGYPVIYDANLRGYRRLPQATPDAVALPPGPRFSSGEFAMVQVFVEAIRHMHPELLDRVLEAVRLRTMPLDDQQSPRGGDISRRIRLLSPGACPVSAAVFQAVTTALIERRRLVINCVRRKNGSVVRREVSPQRVVRLGDRWLLDAWCHRRKCLQVIALDAIASATVLSGTAHEIAADELDHALAVRCAGAIPAARASTSGPPELVP